MEEFKINSNDEVVMKLLHYFITEKNYNPIIVKGAKNEIWLENLQEDYNVIRLVTNQMRNIKQLEHDFLVAQRIVKNIKSQTFSFDVKCLNLYLDNSSNLPIEEKANNRFISSYYIESLDNLKENKEIINIFPDILENTNFKEEGIELFVKITNDLEKKNYEENKKAEEVFSMKKPYITYILIVINIIVMLFSNNELIYLGGLNKNLIIHNNEYYRFITSLFIHGNIWHLFSNLYALYIIGPQLESFLGKTRYLFVYLMSGFIGGLLSTLLNVNAISIGASGAIFGLLASLLVFGYYYRAYLANNLKSQIIPIIFLNLFIGFIIKDIDNFAHIGGLIGGAVSTMMVGIKHRSSKEDMFNGLILTTSIVAYLIFMIFLK